MGARVRCVMAVRCTQGRVACRLVGDVHREDRIVTRLFGLALSTGPARISYWARASQADIDISCS